MVDGYIVNRLPAIDCPEEQKHLSEYLYQNSMLPGSGECCLSEILTAGAFAKIPLVHRIPNIKSAGHDSQCGGDDGLEVHMIYGQNDWMSYEGGLSAQRLCNEKRLQWEQQKENKSSAPPKVFVHGVKDASHLLMLDNYQEFNAAMIIAAGGEADLPSNMPRPVEFVCDEIASAATSGSANYVQRNKNVIQGEKDAASFFRGPRWNRGQKEAKEENVNKERSFEEKKLEDQQLA
jgi:cardiolipin-specific phospholipase